MCNLIAHTCIITVYAYTVSATAKQITKSYSYFRHGCMHTAPVCLSLCRMKLLRTYVAVARCILSPTKFGWRQWSVCDLRAYSELPQSFAVRFRLNQQTNWNEHKANTQKMSSFGACCNLCVTNLITFTSAQKNQLATVTRPHALRPTTPVRIEREICQRTAGKLDSKLKYATGKLRPRRKRRHANARTRTRTGGTLGVPRRAHTRTHTGKRTLPAHTKARSMKRQSGPRRRLVMINKWCAMRRCNRSKVSHLTNSMRCW